MRKGIVKTVLVCSGVCLLSSSLLAASDGAMAPPSVSLSDNPFAGSWQGPFVNLRSNTGGIMGLDIDDNGRLTGWYIWDSGDAGTFVGTLRPDGALRVAAPAGGGGFFGVAQINGAGALAASVRDLDSGAPYTITLAPQ